MDSISRRKHPSNVILIQGDKMNIKVGDLMKRNVLTVSPHKSVEHVLKMMEKNSIHTIPVINQKKEAIGIVTTEDLVDVSKKGAPVYQYMVKHVYHVPEYSDIHIAARVMRNHKINHLVVTHEDKVTGILSSFDLLSLVEGHRFIMKQPPTESPRRRSHFV